MKTTLYSLPAAVALCLALIAPAAAQEKVGPDRYAVTLRNVDLHPATPRVARQTLTRIENAALAVCGVSSFDLSDMKLAARKTPCWRDSMAATMARIDDPLLTQAYHRSY
jgi:UrcA family protein